MENFEELKETIKGSSFNESHLSNTKVVDLETVIGLIEDFEQCNIASVVGQSEQLKAEVFTLANKLALAGEGDAAVAMHRIHNRL